MTVNQLSPRAKAMTDRPNSRPAAGSNRPVRQTARPAVHAGVIEPASGTGPSLNRSSSSPAPGPTRKVPGAGSGSVDRATASAVKTGSSGRSTGSPAPEAHSERSRPAAGSTS